MKFFIDRKYRLPRIWSNKELKRYAHLFPGDIANVSGWKDADKEGKHYRDYFVNAASYTITNYKTEDRGFQGYKNEIFLDLKKELPNDLVNRFDVIFNHTVLEHIYNVHTAFRNLSLMTKDIIILVVPFLQPMHSRYGDFWRFTPLAIKKMFEENKMTLLYLNFNNHKNSSIYIFAIASKNPGKWQDKIQNEFSCLENKNPKDGFEPYIGCNAIQNTGFALQKLLGKVLFKLRVKKY